MNKIRISKDMAIHLKEGGFKVQREVVYYLVEKEEPLIPENTKITRMPHKKKNVVKGLGTHNSGRKYKLGQNYASISISQPSLVAVLQPVIARLKEKGTETRANLKELMAVALKANGYSPNTASSAMTLLVREKFLVEITS